MLPLWLSQNCFGFSSFINSGTAPAANSGNCADSPDMGSGSQVVFSQDCVFDYCLRKLSP